MGRSTYLESLIHSALSVAVMNTMTKEALRGRVYLGCGSRGFVYEAWEQIVAIVPGMGTECLHLNHEHVAERTN